MQNIRHALLALLAVAGTAGAEEQPFLDRLMAADPDAVNAVVMYPASIRDLVFQASTQVGALVRISNLQDRSRRAFQDLIAELAEADQKKLWELSRYPDLVAAIASEKLSDAELTAVLKDMAPAAIHDVAREFNSRKRRHVVSLHELNQAADASFRNLLESYPETERQPLAALLEYPEILDILTRHIDLTAELGDIYRRDPEAVRAKAAELHLRFARENAQADAAWTESLAQDPQALAELEASAADFAEENEVPSYVFTSPPPSSGDPDVVVVVYPYPYWYGYPVWWRHAYWYHRPLWYHTGFYVTPAGTVIIVGTPSYHYTYWHFHVHHHHYHYAHLSYHYARHYDRHREHRHGAVDAIREWERDNRDHLPGDWASERQTGTDWFRDYGRFEEVFAAERERDPGLSRAGFRRQDRDAGRRESASRVEAPERRREIDRLDPGSRPTRQTAGDFHERAWRDDRPRGGRRGS